MSKALANRLARLTKGGLCDLDTLAELIVTEPKELFDHEIDRLIKAIKSGEFDERRAEAVLRRVPKYLIVRLSDDHKQPQAPAR